MERLEKRSLDTLIFRLPTDLLAEGPINCIYRSSHYQNKIDPWIKVTKQEKKRKEKNTEKRSLGTLSVFFLLVKGIKSCEPGLCSTHES